MSANGSKKSEIINSSKISISVVISEKLESLPFPGLRVVKVLQNFVCWPTSRGLGASSKNGQIVQS